MKQDWIKIKSSNTYREFLSFYLTEKSIRPAELARAIGCHRGFPTDVISGKRRLTPKSYYEFEQALRIPSDGKKMFRYLVAREETDILPDLDRNKLNVLIDNLKNKTWTRSRRNIENCEYNKMQNILLNPNTSLVFSATGDPQRGSSFTDIKQRTLLDDDILSGTIAELISVGLLKEESQRYYTQDFHVIFHGLDQNKILSSLFQKACMEASTRAPESWNSESEFFFFSNICIHKNRMAELKKALKETILAFVDDTIEPDGDCIIKLVTSLHC